MTKKGLMITILISLFYIISTIVAFVNHKR